MTVEVLRMPSAAYTPRTGLTFVDVFRLHELYRNLGFRANLLLVAPKGTGKSLSFHAFAAAEKVPIITVDCSEDHRRPHLYGRFIQRSDGSTPFLLGPLPTAIEVANEVGRCILNLEEVNSLSSTAQKLLNPLTDWRVRLEVEECLRTFELKTGSMLWVTGSMPPSGTGGVYQLNDDLKSRFRMLPLTYPTPNDERNIIVAHFPGQKIPQDVVSHVLTLARETRQNSTEYALSTRDVVQAIADFMTVGDRDMGRLLLGKFEGEDVALVRTRFASIFGFTLAP